MTEPASRPRGRRSPSTPRRAPARPGTVHLDLALQGGGSHGAFTWGVLDRLLREPGLAFDGVSGTSAGALNAAVLATGLHRGGPEGAREALGAFWRDVSGADRCFGLDAAAASSPTAPWGAWAPWGTRGSKGWPPHWAEWSATLGQPLAQWNWLLKSMFTQWASPYQFNPLDLNPLRAVAERHVDPEALRRGALKVFVTATSVQTGQAEVFQGERLSIDALLASACLPHLFQAVEIDGVPYWDGGYTGNPALWPLIYGSSATDLLLVKINPLRRDETPRTPMAIADRVGEITFNAGLTGELRAIHFVQRLLDERRIDVARYKNLRLHMVHDEDALADFGPQSKLDTGWDFLQRLHGLGVQAADRWLARHRDDLGVRPTLDIQQTFLRRRGSGPAERAHPPEPSQGVDGGSPPAAGATRSGA